MPEPLNVDDIIEGFSDERNMVAVARAIKERGIEYEWDHDGGLEIEPDPEELLNDPMFMAAIDTQLRKMAADDILYGLEKRNLLESHTDIDGEVIWTLKEGIKCG
jgi:hypothetical protein